MSPSVPSSTPAHAAPAAAVSVDRVVRPRDLTEEDRAHWSGLVADDPLLDRPFFTPEYATLLDAHRTGIEVAVLHDATGPVGYFPFRRESSRSGGPIGGRLDDFQGPILPATHAFDPRAILPALGLRRWRTDHRLLRRPEDAAGAEADPSPFADLSDGFETYFEGKRSEGAGWTKQVPRKRRKLGREKGEVRFVLDSRDPEHFAAMRRWKAEQRRRTHTIDPLDDSDLAAATDAMFRARDAAFRGVLSVLLVDETPVAVHFGLRTRRTLHIWFPTYDPAFDSYSPGMVLLLDLLREASEDGVTRVDFGKGPARYKESLRTGEDTVLTAEVDLRPVGRVLGGAVRSVRTWIRRSPIAPWIRGPRRRIRRWIDDRRQGRSS